MYNSYNNSFFGGIPVVTRNLLIINFIVWGACLLFRPLIDYLALFNYDSGYFSIYQLVTYMFTHATYDMFGRIVFAHILFNMFALFMFGGVLENYWGQKRYLTYYMVTGIGSGLVQLLVLHLQGATEPIPTVGASGAIFGLLLAFGVLFPDTPLYLFFIPIPIKAKYFVIGYGLIELIFGISGSNSGGVAHFAHLGGMLFGIILILYWRKKNGSYRTGNSWNQSWTKRITGFFKGKPKMTIHKRPETDWDYNARKADESKEIDRILEKIKYSGYSSLSEDEKKKLFDAGKK